ncbi:MAG: hypothetical protein KGJ13_05285 [Patescibacteria group bacterium]|nr:hypothetical protein [Patescibacteria group bacterium]
MTLSLVKPSPLRGLAERERRIKILAQLTRRQEFRDITIAKWRQARGVPLSEHVIENLGHWVAGFEQ